MDDLISRRAALDCVTYDVEYTIERIKELPSAQPERNTEFVKLTVRGINGKPYYSIIYLEDGNEVEGYSSYSLDVVSDYLKRYFLSAQPEQKKGEWIKNEWINGKDDGWTCSVCNYHDGDITYDYCPKCKSYNGGEL